MSVIPLTFGRDSQGINAYAASPSLMKYSATLNAGAATSVVVPSSAAYWIVSFRYYPNDVWVNVLGTVATVPAGSTLALTKSELNPASLTLAAGTVISMITALDTADVSVVMWPKSYE